MPLFKRVDQLPAATGVTGTDFLILSRPSGPTGTIGTRAVTLSQLLTYLNTNGGATGPSGPSGVISVSAPLTNSGTSTSAALALSIGSGLSVVGGSLTATGYTLPTASSTVLGGIKIGSGLTIDGTGTVTAAGTYTLPAATVSTLGGVIVGTGLSVTSGNVSVSYGTTSTTACVGNDSRLSDARTPTAHTHSGSDITTGTVAAARIGAHASTHQTGGSDAVANVVVSPTALSAATNNWSIGTGDVFRVSASAAYDLTGIVAGSSGQTILLVNVGSFAITLKHASVSSTAANRFTVPWAGDCILAASGGNAVLVYDGTSSTWRVL